MKGRIKLISQLAILGLAAFYFLFLPACKPGDSFLEKDGWTINTDGKKETLSISHEKLNLVVGDVRLALKDDRDFYFPSDWKIKSNDETLIISARKPLNVTWKFEPGPGRLDISSSADNAFLQGIAPAPENRIPARLESQDNGIMYTSLEFVSARNIHCLFDRETDTMIRFPGQSRLTRNAGDKKLMEISIPVAEGDEISLTADYYLTELGLKYYQPRPKRFKTAPAGWCSWYSYYMGTTEKDMVAETDAVAKYLRDYGMDTIQLDACFTLGEDANYLEWTKKTFPQGGQWLFGYIKSKGLKPGLWVNIYGSNYVKAETADKYPEDFYLRDENGNLSPACCTGDKTEVRLDYTNPEVIEKHLKPMFRILKDGWGLTYLKDAGWGTWMDYYEKNKARSFNPAKDSREVYVEAQKALRETLGDEIFINGCAMHEVGLCFDIFDGSRTGGDDRAVWTAERKRGMSMQTYFHSLFGANYLNNITWFSDPDTVMVRSPLTLDEATTIVTAIALTGQLYMASDFMGQLPENRLDLYRKTIPTTPIVPIDLYPYRIEANKRDSVVWCCPQVKEFPRAIDLKVNAVSEDYDVVAVFNWGDKEEVKTIDLAEDLGLEPDRDYLIFDFWRQKSEGIARGKIESSIPAHGTSVYIVRPVAERPQLLATSRHITGTVSIKKLDWDGVKATLIGVSETVAGEPYSVFIHVPDGMKISKIDADLEILSREIADNVLEIKFAGFPGTAGLHTIDWTITF